MISVGLIISLVATFIIGVVFGIVFSPKGESLGGLIHNIQESFDAGIAVGGTEVINSSGDWVGDITGAGTNVLSGTNTFSGASTFTSSVQLLKTASSTLQVGKVGGTTYAGCIILGDTSATTTLTYITADSGTLTATTTKPTYCQTAL